jgi:hypothetical protein
LPCSSLLRFPDGPLLRDMADLNEPAVHREDIYHLSSARVVVAEYELLQHDFFDLSEKNLIRRNPDLDRLDPAERRAAIQSIIDDWLIANAAFVSAAQTGQAIVNTPIATDGGPITGYRPPRYGRSIVVSLKENAQLQFPTALRWKIGDGLLDLKGAGVAAGEIPSHEMHSDGLEYLGVALGDFVLRAIVEEIFRRAAPTLWSVPIYAILDLGFDVRSGWRGTAEAGMHVRRTHRRPFMGSSLPASGSPEEQVQCEIEMLLRNYGLTSIAGVSALMIEEQSGSITARIGGEVLENLTEEERALLQRLKGTRDSLRIDRVNIQLIREVGTAPSSGQMVDFGHMNVRRKFFDPISSAVNDRPFCLGGILWPDDATYIQPKPGLLLPNEFWNRLSLNELCFDLASKFRKREISQDELRRVLEEPIHQAIYQWDRVSEQ